MHNDLGYGPRLSDEEYDHRIVTLHCSLPPSPSQSEQTRIRRQELDLAIDHRLGRDFPRPRRDALWLIHQRVEKRRSRLIFKYLLRRMFSRRLARDVQTLSGYLIDEYAKVLSTRELECYFGASEVANRTVPIDLSQLKDK